MRTTAGRAAVRGAPVAVAPVRMASRISRQRSVTVEARKVALMGAAGGIGQPLALLLKVRGGQGDAGTWGSGELSSAGSNELRAPPPLNTTGGLFRAASRPQ
jgi:hypothetical protein